MARPHVYRRHIRCPAGGSNWRPKHGAAKGRQVARCDDCKRYHIPDAAYTRPSAADKERGLALYQEGVSLSAIARSFDVTPSAVSRWVKKADWTSKSNTSLCWECPQAGAIATPPIMVISPKTLPDFMEAQP